MTEEEISGGTEPCFGHHLVDGHVIDPDTARDVARFRRSERTRLYAMRKAVPHNERKTMAAAIAAGLDQKIGAFDGVKIAAYWPIRGELDLRDWMADIHERGAIVALPVVVETHQPVVFCEWTPQTVMRRGHWNIPVPETVKPITPDVVIAPLLGVDEHRYRLGNGGGYYDRTLSRIAAETLTIGAGHALSRIPTIFPMPWDIPMDAVILGDGSGC